MDHHFATPAATEALAEKTHFATKFKGTHRLADSLYIQSEVMLENLIISQDIRDKLLRDDHNVKEEEVRECFLNHDGSYLEDSDEEHLRML